MLLTRLNLKSITDFRVIWHGLFILLRSPEIIALKYPVRMKILIVIHSTRKIMLVRTNLITITDGTVGAVMVVVQAQYG